VTVGLLKLAARAPLRIATALAITLLLPLVRDNCT
jgi:hypothetical protein